MGHQKVTKRAVHADLYEGFGICLKWRLWDPLYYDPVVQMSELIYQSCMVDLRVRLSAQGMDKTKIKNRSSLQQ